MLFFFPYRPIKVMAGIYQVLMQVGIMLTGNYNFFNLLSITMFLNSLFGDPDNRNSAQHAVALR